MLVAAAAALLLALASSACDSGDKDDDDAVDEVEPVVEPVADTDTADPVEAPVKAEPTYWTDVALHAAIREANPGYTGNGEFHIENGQVKAVRLAQCGIADISPLAEVNLETLGHDAYFFQPESKVRWVAGVPHEAASDNFAGESEATEIPLYYWLQSDVGAGVTFKVYQGNVEVASVEGSGGAGLHKVAWGMTKTPPGGAQPAPQGPARFQGRSRGQPAPVGEYTVVMSAGGQEMSRKVSPFRR